MSEITKKIQKELPPYNSKPHPPEDVPNYKELYFNLMEQFETIRTFIKMIQDKSMNEFNKSFKPTKINSDE